MILRRWYKLVMGPTPLTNEQLNKQPWSNSLRRDIQVAVNQRLFWLELSPVIEEPLDQSEYV